MEIDVIARTRSREIEDLLAKKERDETLLNKVRDKAAEELDQMEYTSAMEATKAIDMAINSSRKITDQTINLQFITDVLEAITATITDEAMRHKLGIELRKIFQVNNMDLPVNFVQLKPITVQFDSKTIREVMTTDEIREELGLEPLGDEDTVEQDVKLSKVGMVDGKPVFSTIEEAEAYAKTLGCEGYHEHDLDGQTAYMA